MNNLRKIVRGEIKKTLLKESKAIFYNEITEMKHQDSEASRNSALTFGNKPATAADIGIGLDVNKLPTSNGIRILNNPNLESRIESANRVDAESKNRRLYRTEAGEEHPSKSVERFYEGLNKSLMMFLFCESNPDDINLREDNRIFIGFDVIIEELDNFNHLDGGPNYENYRHVEIKSLLKEFNDKFGCKYVISDHVNTKNGVGLFIEHNTTSQIDMSQDSMSMMKKFLLAKVMTGHKIEEENSHIASLLGLDAGDTTWLYGPVGQKPQSGIISKRR